MEVWSDVDVVCVVHLDENVARLRGDLKKSLLEIALRVIVFIVVLGTRPTQVNVIPKARRHCFLLIQIEALSSLTLLTHFHYHNKLFSCNDYPQTLFIDSTLTTQSTPLSACIEKHNHRQIAFSWLSAESVAEELRTRRRFPRSSHDEMSKRVANSFSKWNDAWLSYKVQSSRAWKVFLLLSPISRPAHYSILSSSDGSEAESFMSSSERTCCTSEKQSKTTLHWVITGKAVLFDYWRFEWIGFWNLQMFHNSVRLRMVSGAMVL